MAKTWYDKWHESDHHRTVHWAIFILFIAVFWVLFSSRIQDWIDLNEPGITVNLAKPEANLALSPQSKSVQVGDTFSVDMVLDTAGKPIDGVDVYALHYDPSLLSVVDDLKDQSGIQISPGNVLSVNAANEVSPQTGTIKFSQLATGGTNFSGSGVLATIHFRALASGTAYLKFDFERRSTIDTNAAFKGKDQLARVVDGIYIINPK